MSAPASARMFVAPLVADLNEAKAILAHQDFGRVDSARLWGPGLTHELMRISAFARSTRLLLREEHPWATIRDAGPEVVRQVTDGVLGQVRTLVPTAVVAFEYSPTTLVVRWEDPEDPPQTSLGIRMVACALAVVRRGGQGSPAAAAADPLALTGSLVRTGSLAQALSWGRR